MVRLWELYAKWNKSDGEGQILYVFTRLWNIKHKKTFCGLVGECTQSCSHFLRVPCLFHQTSWCSAHMPNFLFTQEFVETLCIFSHFQDLPIKFLFGPLFPSPQPANLVLQKAAGFPWLSVLSPVLSAGRAVGFYFPTNWFIPH